MYYVCSNFNDNLKLNTAVKCFKSCYIYPSIYFALQECVEMHDVCVQYLPWSELEKKHPFAVSGVETFYQAFMKWNA